MKNLVFIILMMTVNGSFAKNKENIILDSLKIELSKAKNDTTRVTILNQLSKNNFYREPKTGIQHSENALKIAQKIKWQKGIAEAYNNLGVCYWVDANYLESIKNFKKSLSYYQQLKDKKGISNAYNFLGSLYVEIKNYNQAFIYFFKAKEINKLTHDKQAISYNFSCIAQTFHKLKKYDKAIYYYNQSKEVYQSIYDKNGQANCYNNIAKIYFDLDDYNKSKDYFEKAINMFDQYAKYYLTDSYLGIGKTYHSLSLESKKNKSKNLKLSIHYLNKALVLFTQFNTYGKINESHQALYKVYKDQGNDKLALKHFEKFVDIQESILSYKNEAKLGELKTKKEIELSNHKIEIQELKINRDTKKVYQLVSITFFITILLILFLYLYITKRNTNKLLLEKNKEISNINKQKDKFFSIIAHDLRGPISGFQGMTELLAEDIKQMDKEEIQFVATNMKSSANNLSNLLDNLLEWSKMEQGLIPFNPKKHNLLSTVKECTTTQQDALNKKNIKIETDIDQSLVIYADRHITQSVIRNIVSNAVKFTPRGGKIKIQGKEDHNHTTISITDSGIGMDAKMIENIFKLDVKTNRKGTDDEPSSGLGLILCKEFTEKHGGTICIESEVNKGSTFYFNIPRVYA